jgi:hypothetical protein
MVVDIPGWLESLIAFPVVFYRRMRYGYTFRKIKLKRGEFAIVDPDDYESLSCYNWYASKSGQTTYAITSEKINGKWKLFKMHRKIIEVGPDLSIDHINHNGLDNRKANLRPATFAQNTRNRRNVPHSSRFKGVNWNKHRKKWKASVTSACKITHLGYFDDEMKAARAYDEAAKTRHGEFAALNFSDK